MAKSQDDFSLKVTRAFIEDEGKGLARLDPDDLDRLHAIPGDALLITGRRSTVARAAHAPQQFCGQGLVLIDGITRDNAQISVDEECTVQKVPYKQADSVILSPVDIRSALPKDQEIPHIRQLLSGLHVVIGDRIQITMFGTKPVFYMVEGGKPPGRHPDHGPYGNLLPGFRFRLREGDADLLRGHRRPGKGARPRPGDDRASPEVPRAVRPAGDRSPQGSPSLGSPGNRARPSSPAPSPTRSGPTSST